MNAFNKIAVIFNPTSDNTLALEHASRIAKTGPSTIELLAFIHHSEYQFLETVRSEVNFKSHLETEIQAQMERQIAPMLSEGIEISTHIEWCDQVVAAILSRVERENYHLLIKSPHPYSALTKIISTPTDWAIIRSCPCPVWFCKSELQANSAIIAAVDVDSDDSTKNALAKKVLHQANYFAHLLGCQLHVINTFPAMPAEAHMPFVAIYENEYLEKVQQERQQTLKPLLEAFDLPLAHCHIMAGSTDQVIYDYVKRHTTSLLVMGSNTRHGLAGLMSGNTAEGIVNRIECDLLVVPAG